MATCTRINSLMGYTAFGAFCHGMRVYGGTGQGEEDTLGLIDTTERKVVQQTSPAIMHAKSSNTTNPQQQSGQSSTDEQGRGGV